MRKIILVLKYIKYWFSAKNKFSIHSPFVYELKTSVIDENIQDSNFSEIEKLRKSLLENQAKIEVIDLGAGSSLGYSNERTIREITQKYAKSPKNARLLYKLINHFKPKTILELGTSLGISTSYQAIAAPQSKITTIEGCPNTAKIAENNFNHLGLENIKLIVGNFDEKLPDYLNSISKLDYAFIDGNHTKKATLDYFLQCLNKSHSESLFVFDDIHWSNDMEEAWNIIKKNEKVKITIDLFFFGLVFFNEDLSKEDFILKF
ncbi:MAG: class I SAM-dependent methyltransferase [Saprospiraceae bacterium]|nr:class I SAM-dependent methyltransferase [Saprospiraceae bacterium]